MFHLKKNLFYNYSFYKFYLIYYLIYRVKFTLYLFAHFYVNFQKQRFDHKDLNVYQIITPVVS